MRAVTIAVEWVRIGMRDRLIGLSRLRIGVVAVADEINAALDARRARAEPARIRRLLLGCVRSGIGSRGARAAESRVRVIDAGVDDRHLHALAVQP